MLNDSRVLPARLIGRRSTGGACEVLLLIDKGEGLWECLVRPGRKMKPGAQLSFGEGSSPPRWRRSCPAGTGWSASTTRGSFWRSWRSWAGCLCPPYIKAELQDNERYQTVYSKVLGSAAAPTAGLHFTPELLRQVGEMGVRLCYVTLHVGLGTFRPVKEEEITDHEMHSEYCMVPRGDRPDHQRDPEERGPGICVGTTSCRTVESFAAEDGTMEESAGWTNIFIYPGYRFKVLDGLITNFHLPESTLIMLVSALAGREHVLAAYREAVRERYRFFSFGDIF